MKVLRTPLKLLLLIFLILFLISSYQKGQLSQLDEMSYETSVDPVQSPVTGSTGTSFDYNGYTYTVDFLYDYTITGVLVHKWNYGFFTEVFDKTVPYDLCIVWGENVIDGRYRADGVRYSQDSRYCKYTYPLDKPIRADQLSNNHLFIKDRRLISAVNRLNVGDEIRIEGKLINASAARTSSSQANKSATYTSSTTRKDTGAGACEIIYVESIDVINYAHPTAAFINIISRYGIIIVLSVQIVLFLYTSRGPKLPASGIPQAKTIYPRRYFRTIRPTKPPEPVYPFAK